MKIEIPLLKSFSLLKALAAKEFISLAAITSAGDIAKGVKKMPEGHKSVCIGLLVNFTQLLYLVFFKSGILCNGFNWQTIF